MKKKPKINKKGKGKIKGNTNIEEL